MRVLVTGGSGFIGGALAPRLREQGMDVWAPARSALDLAASSSLEGALHGQGISVVVHLAASRERLDPDPSRFVPETKMNLEATARLFDAARRAAVPAMIHLSTLSVFRPRALGELIDETSPKVEAPAHPYALTKKWSEELAVSLRSSFEAVAVVRPGMTYGPSATTSSGMARLADRVRASSSYALNAPDGDTYSPIFIDDVVDVIVRLVERPANVAVNLTGMDPLTERTIVTDIAALSGRSVAIETTPDRALSMAASTALADALFPGRTRTTWRDGARSTFCNKP